MEKGYATFHHPLTVHGSYENLSERPRRAFVLNVFADGTLSDSDNELLEGVPVIAKGNQMFSVVSFLPPTNFTFSHFPGDSGASLALLRAGAEYDRLFSMPSRNRTPNEDDNRDGRYFL